VGGRVKRWKRRRPGIYLFRTDKHLAPGRRENGYVRLSNNVDMRERCHRGKCSHKGHEIKPWMVGLRARRHTLRLPWWLGFRWALEPLETLAILLLAPRYNHAKNLWNPRRVPLSTQRAQAMERQRETGRLAFKRQVTALGYAALRVAGLLLIITGAVGAWITR
jgi:hypothetical protein